MNFNYYALNPVFITVYYLVKELIEDSTLITKGLFQKKKYNNRWHNKLFSFTSNTTNNQIKPICFKCIAGENIEFPPKVSYIDVTKYDEKELTSFQDNCYPIVIKMVLKKHKKM